MKKIILMLGLLVLVIACTSDQKETFSFQGRINANPEFLRINQSDSVEILENNLNYEDIPKNATYCYPVHDNMERCQWIKGADEKYHQSCVVDLVYREICFTNLGRS